LKDISVAVQPIPEGYHSITPYLIIRGAAAAIDFYRRAFGATERMRVEHDGGVGHAELQIGDSVVMLADEAPQMGCFAPEQGKQPPVMLHLYVEDVDATFQQAVAAGATVVRPLEDQFYGDRTAGLSDPFGHVWHVATHTEDVSEEEIHRRMQQMKQQHAQG
jgi:PhnB protein